LKSTGLALGFGPWETVFMQKRAVRIVKHLGSVPVEAICTFCSRVFKAPVTTLSKLKDATENLQQQFDRHKCREDASQAAARIASEATKD